MRMLKSEWSGNASLIIFDEIHKYNKWKTFIKGEYDKLKKKYKFILTGSARLDILSSNFGFSKPRDVGVRVSQ